jgi:hypothetical protein
MLFADDIMIFSKVKRPIEAETTLQLAIDDAFRWGRKWKLSFAPGKSALIVFTSQERNRFCLLMATG